MSYNASVTAQGEDTDWLCGSISAIAEVFKLTDPTLLFLEVSTLVSKYPDIRSALTSCFTFSRSTVGVYMCEGLKCVSLGWGFAGRSTSWPCWRFEAMPIVTRGRWSSRRWTRVNQPSPPTRCTSSETSPCQPSQQWPCLNCWNNSLTPVLWPVWLYTLRNTPSSWWEIAPCSTHTQKDVCTENA